MLDLGDPRTLRTILDNLQTGLYVTDRERRIVFWNKGAEKITGYMRHTVVGHLCCETLQFGQGKKMCAFCGSGCPPDETLSDGVSIDAHVYLHHKAGYMIPVRVRTAAIRDTHGSVVGIFRAFEEQQAVLGTSREILASHGCLDDISGVPNHRYTEFHLRESLLGFAEYNLPFGILCIAVPEIDRVREIYGKEAASAILRMVAQTGVHILGTSTFLGRWKENEFIAIVMNCNSAELEKRGADVQRVGSSSHITWWDDRISTEVVVAQTRVRPGDTLETLLSRAEHRASKVHGQEAARTNEVQGHDPLKG
jgi:GGDEF domain-containing protein